MRRKLLRFDYYKEWEKAILETNLRISLIKQFAILIYGTCKIRVK